VADQDIHKKHRNDLSKMEIQKEEYQQLIFNEEKLTKEYATKAQGYLENDPLQSEFENLELDYGELQYELTKYNQEIKTQGIEIDQMRLTISSHNRSIRGLSCSVQLSKNKTCDIRYSSESLKYEYQEKYEDTIPEASGGLEESSFYNRDKMDDLLFDNHDVKTATASKFNTTVTRDASHLFDKNSYTANSFHSKSLLIDCEDEAEVEDSMLYQRKKNRKLKNANYCCEGPSCIII
jgi:hypothetical protein